MNKFYFFVSCLCVCSSVWTRMVPWPLTGLSGVTTSCLNPSLTWRMWHATGNDQWWGYTPWTTNNSIVCLKIMTWLDWRISCLGFDLCKTFLMFKCFISSSLLFINPMLLTMVSVDVGYRWAAVNPRWILGGGEEVWLCVAAADGWSLGWICISDWNCPLRPPQSFSAGQSGTVVISD